MRLPAFNSRRLRPPRTVFAVGVPLVSFLLLGALCPLWAENPCEHAAQRALVLSGGGVKGAFEAGAVYDLVVFRHCDFSDFSGVSVGALNAVFLAQAPRAMDHGSSSASLADQSEALVSLWQSLRSSRDIARSRRFATMRFGLFGLDSMYDFTPLRRLEQKSISIEKLSRGRPVRVGVVSVQNGEYTEVPAESKANFLDYLFASSIPPVMGKLAAIRAGEAKSESGQFADGGLRHITPVASYFMACPASVVSANDMLPPARRATCGGAEKESFPAHEAVQQLFVIVTSPYSRDTDSLPVLDRTCCRPGTRVMTDGRKILSRTLGIFDDQVYRQDLDFLQSANDVLTWRWRTYKQMTVGASPEQIADVKERFRVPGDFTFESYNRDADDLDSPSRPYDIGLVAPEKEYADLKNLLVITPGGIQEQLYCGCVAADQMMQRRFGLPSLSHKCVERFPRIVRGERLPSGEETPFEASVCRAKSNPESWLSERPAYLQGMEAATRRTERSNTDSALGFEKRRSRKCSRDCCNDVR